MLLVPMESVCADKGLKPVIKGLRRDCGCAALVIVGITDGEDCPSFVCMARNGDEGALVCIGTDGDGGRLLFLDMGMGGILGNDKLLDTGSFVFGGDRLFFFSGSEHLLFLGYVLSLHCMIYLQKHEKNIDFIDCVENVFYLIPYTCIFLYLKLLIV